MLKDEGTAARKISSAVRIASVLFTATLLFSKFFLALTVMRLRQCAYAVWLVLAVFVYLLHYRLKEKCATSLAPSSSFLCAVAVCPTINASGEYAFLFLFFSVPYVTAEFVFLFKKGSVRPSTINSKQ